MRRASPLLGRTITSVSWSAAANVARLLVSLVRYVVLARLLPLEVFGVYALAVAIVKLSGSLTRFGLGGAFLHRAPETRDEATAAAVYATLRLALLSVWGVVMVAGALAVPGDLRIALWVLVGAEIGFELASTPRLVLARRVEHSRIALYEALRAFAEAGVSIALALSGATLGALLAANVTGAALGLVVFYAWRPPWRPRLAWSAPVVRYYWRFGRTNFAAGVLVTLLDRLDDLFVGVFLGSQPLGLYSRAYRLAGYTREAVAHPVNMVIGGTYAELKGQRRRLSLALHGSVAALARVSFPCAGLLFVLADDLIPWALGPQWTPMVGVVRWLAVFAMLDPLRGALASLFVAVGQPRLLIRARLVQLATLVGGLALLGRQGITGVAAAVDAMLVVGIGCLLVLARPYVDLSPWRLAGPPVLALVAALLAASVLPPWLAVASGSPAWAGATLEGLTLGLVYLTVLFALEHREWTGIWWKLRARSLGS